MRLVSLAMHVSLDGYVAGPGGELEWIFTQVDDEITNLTRDYLASIDTMLSPIGHIATDHRALDEVSSQASCAPDEVATITLRPELVDGLLGLDRCRYLWVLTWLDRPGSTDEAPLRLVPRAAEASGQVSGVFASRSPRRPNPIGLSLVRHVKTRGNVVTIAGVDLLDGTPVLDIKPWFGDCDDPQVFAPTD